ncbi:MAG: ImmA/IrrE family metallo-endopeptidase [Gemmatimonadetes bacterium]|nr:ImmA/IrrE family metallo-endopeptidase [Gemmatimonadota bacterium]MYB55706.1 ImmA/IrrE family metallo-endopeptidase [Gemmatimonadota bacterium]
MWIIESEADQLLVHTGINTPPVPVEQVAHYLGIKIELANLGEDCSGVLVRNGKRAIIGVNKKHPRNRRRFSIAHEIGHFMLHEGDTYIDNGYRVQFRDLESGSGTIGEEMDANAFAAALLMPAEWVKNAFYQQPFDLTEDGVLQMLAQKFQVSTQAMSYRLMRLRLL